MHLSEVNHFHRFVLVFIQVPDLEVLRSVDDEEFAETVHQATPQTAAFIVAVVVH